ncbi:LuxR C-terminal-related transcriptional regulator [Mycobacterium sp. 236(2023)]|uniref:helix-turn-helix transcriptional regulator n=1 Tax=Mycobacterium sp. 236(2023) TaxID=3038163 RepID=UPI0024154F94|nr:LuxR C-terminal-related transcriptional regulator [Mycobacterium sp. 236(2023)]MDG4664781.1 LuxR C-terminal-related transcriptional regulator [Mycobacterium sp. 236(2023)]
MVAIEDFSRMVSGVYGAAAASDTWACAMAEIRSVFGGLTAAMIETDGTDRIVKSANLSDEAATAYVGYYRNIDYVLSAVERSPVGLVQGGRELIALQPRSEFDADWMRPNNLNDGLFVRLSGAAHTTSFLVAGDRTREEFDTAERAALLDLFIPHLQQALRTERSLRKHSLSRDALTLAIDTVGYGVVAIGANAVVQQMNQPAEQMVRDADGITLRSGSISASDPVAARRLARSIAAALGGAGDTVRSGDSLLCPRPSGLRPYVVHVLPSTRDATACAVVVVIDPERIPEPTIAMLRRLYELTYSEALVATHVLRGHGLRAIADDLSVSLATVKTHLQHVFAKTETHRQSELVRLLLSINR